MLEPRRLCERSVEGFLLSILLLFVHSAAYAAGGSLLWEDRVDFGGFDVTGAVATRHGMVVVVGAAETTAGTFDFDIAVRAYDGATGSLIWQDRFHTGSFLDATGVVVLGDHVAVVGGDPGIIRAYDLVSGTLLWQDLYAAASVGSVQTLVMHGNQVVATGYGGAGCTDALIGCDMVTRVYDARTGTLLWQDKFDGSGGFDQGNGIAATENVVVVAGFTEPASGDASAFVVRAYDAGSGDLLWQDQGATLPNFPFATQVVAAAGQVFVVGNDDNDDWLIRAYQARTGTLLWKQTYHLAAAGLAGVPDVAFQVATDGKRVVVAGYGSHAPVPPQRRGQRDWVVNTYDAKTGTLLWSDVLDLAGKLDEAVGGVAIHRGQVFVHGVVTSSTPGLAGLDMLIRAYDLKTGRLLWQDEVDKGGAEFPTGTWFRGLAADNERVTIVGISEIDLPDGSFAADWIVRTYDASNSRKDEDHDEDE